MAKKDKRPLAQDAKKGKSIDPVRSFAEKLRDHKELDSRWAILQESRVEFFRGKDFASVLRNHPEVYNSIPSIVQTDQMAEVLMKLLISKQLAVRCDRVVKTIRPGKKKLSKWPARLEFHDDQCFSDNDAFYAWTFERQRPIWQTFLSFMVPIVTVACCLFPVFPHWCKLLVLYTCLSFLALIFTILFLRWVVFGMIWIFVGKRVWFFPNILAEEASLQELIRFMPDDKADKDTPPTLIARLAVAVTVIIVSWLCVQNAPDESARRRYRKKVGNIIDDVVSWSPAMLTAKTSVNETQFDKNNATHNSVHNVSKESNFTGNLKHNTSVDELLDDPNITSNSRDPDVRLDDENPSMDEKEKQEENENENEKEIDL